MVKDVLWSCIKTSFLLACKVEGGTHGRRGKESELVRRLALVRVFWRLLCGGKGFIAESG